MAKKSTMSTKGPAMKKPQFAPATATKVGKKAAPKMGGAIGTKKK